MSGGAWYALGTNLLNAKIYQRFSFVVSQQVNYYNFSINYYDKAGRLKLNVPPAGVDVAYIPSAGNSPNHRMIKSTTYDSYNEVASTISPDAGLTNFIYRADGKVRFSQNAKQVAFTQGQSTNSSSGALTTLTYSVSAVPGFSLFNNYNIQYVFPSTITAGQTFNVTINIIVGAGGDIPNIRQEYNPGITLENGFSALANGTTYASGSQVYFEIPYAVASSTPVLPIGQTLYSITFSVIAPANATTSEFGIPLIVMYVEGGGEANLSGNANPGNLKSVNIITPIFSYINYDNVGRVIETGEYNPSIASSVSPLAFSQAYVNTPTDAGRCSQQNYVMYDAGDITYSSYKNNQLHLSGKVSKTWNANSTTWYSYDELGRTAWTVQQLNNINSDGSAKYFTLNYSYDLNGNVTQVAYQKELANEDFYYYYQYDKDKRLQRYLTSIDGVNQTEQAAYYYYTHGALKRVEVANKGQGIDYVYTINGWLKSINSPELNDRDPGKDGTSASIYRCPKDAFGMTLDYFAKDYTRANTSIQTYQRGADLFNGVMKAQRWQTAIPNGVPSGTIQYPAEQLCNSYTYDNKYQLTASAFSQVTNAGSLNGQGTIKGAGPLLASSSIPNAVDYQVSGITYDLNGNLLSLNRNGYFNSCTGVSSGCDDMDKLTYHYNMGSGGYLQNNMLNYVSDAVTTDNYPANFGLKQGQAANNYQYDLIGEQIANVNDGSTTVYDVYGHVQKVTYGEKVVSFLYDEKGRRIQKTDGTKTTWYVRDAGGNVMSVYETSASSGLQQAEVGLSADNRIGSYYPQSNTYLYELSDHLGNVRATFTNVLASSISTSFNGTDANDYVFNNSGGTIDKTFDHRGTGNVSSLKLSAKGSSSWGGYLSQIRVNAGQVVSGSLWAYAASSTIPFSSDGIYLNLTDQNGNVLKSVYQQIVFNGNTWNLSNFSFSIPTNGYFSFIVKNSSSNPLWVDDININFSRGGVNVFAQQSLTDYYPHGSVMPGRTYTSAQSYRYGYQGQYCETDPETGLDNFEARMYDPLLGRWNTTDPAGQYYSPYVGMGNNPVMTTDKDGKVAGPLDIIIDPVAALIGGIANLASNWSSVEHSDLSLLSAIEYFGAGAAGGFVAAETDNLALGFAVAGALNVHADAASGQLRYEGGNKSVLESFVSGGLSALTGEEGALDVADQLGRADELTGQAKSFYNLLNPVGERNVSGQLLKGAYRIGSNVLQGYGDNNYSNGGAYNIAGDIVNGAIGSGLDWITDSWFSNRKDFNIFDKVFNTGAKYFSGTIASGISGAAGSAINNAIAPQINPDTPPAGEQISPFYKNEKGVYENRVEGAKGAIPDIFVDLNGGAVGNGE